MAPFVLPVSMIAMNYALAATTTAIAVFALGLLLYAAFVRPDFTVNSSRLPESTADFATIAPTRLTKNNLIHAVPNKDHVIDLKELGLETNEIVEQGARNDREIEAHLHSEIEAALSESPEVATSTPIPSTSIDAIAEFGPDAFDDTPALTSTAELNLNEGSTVISATQPAPTASYLEGRFVDEVSTIEPPFDRVLAFPDCERTKDGHKYC